MIVCMTCQMEMKTCNERSTAWVAQTQLEHPVAVVQCPCCGCTVANVNRGIERHSEEAEPGVLVLDLKETPCLDGEHGETCRSLRRDEIATLRAALADIARGDYSDPLCMRTPEQRAREALAPRKDKQ